MIRFALLLFMSLTLSSQAFAAVKWSNSSGSKVEEKIQRVLNLANIWVKRKPQKTLVQDFPMT